MPRRAASVVRLVHDKHEVAPTADFHDVQSLAEYWCHRQLCVLAPAAVDWQSEGWFRTQAATGSTAAFIASADIIYHPSSVKV